jgi:hypothetical protein
MKLNVHNDALNYFNFSTLKMFERNNLHQRHICVRESFQNFHSQI